MPRRPRCCRRRHRHAHGPLPVLQLRGGGEGACAAWGLAGCCYCCASLAGPPPCITHCAPTRCCSAGARLWLLGGHSGAHRRVARPAHSHGGLHLPPLLLLGELPSSWAGGLGWAGQAAVAAARRCCPACAQLPSPKLQPRSPLIPYVSRPCPRLAAPGWCCRWSCCRRGPPLAADTPHACVLAGGPPACLPPLPPSSGCKRSALRRRHAPPRMCRAPRLRWPGRRAACRSSGWLRPTCGELFKACMLGSTLASASDASDAGLVGSECCCWAAVVGGRLLGGCTRLTSAMLHPLPLRRRRPGRPGRRPAVRPLRLGRPLPHGCARAGRRLGAGHFCAAHVGRQG